MIHLIAALLLVLTAILEERFGMVFGIVVAGVVGMLLLEHSIVRKQGVRGLPIAFFTLNGIISILIAVAGVADLLLAA